MTPHRGPLNKHVRASVYGTGWGGGGRGGVDSVFFFFTLLSHSPPPAHELLAELAPASLFQMLMTSGSESLKLDH